MHNAAAISAVYRALANYRRRQANAPTDHSAREIVQLSMLAEYLHETTLRSSPGCEVSGPDLSSLPAGHYLPTQGGQNHDCHS